MMTDNRNSGVALWRQIADSLRQDIEAQAMAPGSLLPPEVALAERFGVNRHTVRAAIGALAEEGLLRAERGRGTFVQASPRLSYRLSDRTRMSESLSGQHGRPSGAFLSEAQMPADASVAAALKLAVETQVIVLETMSSVDERPLACSTHFLPADRFEGIGSHLAATGSITAALAHYGVSDYTRHSTTVLARPADAGEVRILRLTPGSTVLVSKGIDVDFEGRRLQLVISRFNATRVELQIGAD